MKPDDIEALRMMVQARSGVVVDPAKTYVIESRLGPLARREGFPAVGELIAAIRSRRDEKLMWAATEAMTCTETSFFRDEAVFTALRQDILPRLVAARQGGSVRIWSAACASGQEAYSLAMAIDEDAGQLTGAKLELFASDLSEACLEKALSGLYTQFEVQRGLPARLLIRHFEKQGEMWRVDPRLSAAIRFRRINLLADLKPLGQFDIIFCRYAIKQFDAQTQARTLGQFAHLLTPDGVLVLGVNEKADGVDALAPVAAQPGVFRRNPAIRAAA
jgi:chemotaxis protein methyltransferase CheR